MREYLSALDGETTTGVTPKAISLTDPQARWTAAPGGPFFAYSTNYLIDTECGVILDVEATPPIAPQKLRLRKRCSKRVEAHLDLKPES